MAHLVCQACGARVTREEPIGREAACDACGQDLRACRNCRHWDPRYHGQCTETEAEPPADKLRRNFCEFFYFSRAPFAGGPPVADRAAEARAKLDALFGGVPPAPAAGPGDARARLEALFRKPDEDPPQ